MQTDLGAPWNSRVESSDASPGGHGRAWTQLPLGIVARLGQLSATKGVYTTLEPEHGVELSAAAVCPLQQ
eukprot:6460482-Lingulodinium_polyedra.AAC.1